VLHAYIDILDDHRQPPFYATVSISAAGELQTFPTFEFMAYQEAHISVGFCQRWCASHLEVLGGRYFRSNKDDSKRCQAQGAPLLGSDLTNSNEH
jgi:hypothetical protein